MERVNLTLSIFLMSVFLSKHALAFESLNRSEYVLSCTGTHIAARNSYCRISDTLIEDIINGKTGVAKSKVVGDKYFITVKKRINVLGIVVPQFSELRLDDSYRLVQLKKLNNYKFRDLLVNNAALEFSTMRLFTYQLAEPAILFNVNFPKGTIIEHTTCDAGVCEEDQYAYIILAKDQNLQGKLYKKGDKIEFSNGRFIANSWF